jgi:hypothetical protein
MGSALPHVVDPDSELAAQGAQQPHPDLALQMRDRGRPPAEKDPAMTTFAVPRVDAHRDTPLAAEPSKAADELGSGHRTKGRMRPCDRQALGDGSSRLLAWSQHMREGDPGASNTNVRQAPIVAAAAHPYTLNVFAARPLRRQRPCCHASARSYSVRSDDSRFWNRSTRRLMTESLCCPIPTESLSPSARPPSGRAPGRCGPGW